MKLIKTTSREFVPVSFSSIIDQFFSDSIAQAGGSSFLPAVDLAETEKGYEIHLSVPGMKKEDFKLEVEANLLTITGERRWNDQKGGKTFHQIESRFGSFSRSFTIPENAAASRIEAAYNNGILEVLIPKDEQKSLKTTIRVN